MIRAFINLNLRLRRTYTTARFSLLDTPLNPNISAPLLPINTENNTIRKHCDQKPNTPQHERERVVFGNQTIESIIGIAQELHQSSPQKHSSGELGTQQNKPFVPLHQVGGDSGDECGDE